MPLIMPNVIALGQIMYKKAWEIFLHSSVFWCPRGTPCAKVHQSGWWCIARPPLSSCQTLPLSENSQRDICCQSSSILLTAWPTHRHTKTVNNIVSTYHAVTNESNNLIIWSIFFAYFYLQTEHKTVAVNYSSHLVQWVTLSFTLNSSVKLQF